MLQDVKPTRSELIELKKKIELARKGHKLLKMKRDGLITEFFRVLKDAKNLRMEIINVYNNARHLEAIAECIDGKIAVESAAMALKNISRVSIKPINIMGVSVPHVLSTAEQKLNFISPLGTGIIGTSTRIEDTARAYTDLLRLIIKAAQYETALRRLIEEIDKVKRRVNALEYRIIPELMEKEAIVRMRLEELERENIFRLKMMKGES
ncbi:MAG: V-type ATP synthase subunit D [Thermoplasmata archaeon]